MNILIVEDDLDWRDALTRIFHQHRHEVIAFQDVVSAWNYLQTYPMLDALLIDHVLPGGPFGVSLVKRARLLFPHAAIVMMSLFADRELVIEALRGGVDDFITRPIPPNILISKLDEVVLRRKGEQIAAQPAYQVGALELDLAARRAIWYGAELQLTPVEFSLLSQLLAHPGRVLNYAELYALSRGEHLDPSQARTRLKSHILNLKRKLVRPDLPANETPLKTVYGFGFKWEIPLIKEQN